MNSPANDGNSPSGIYRRPFIWTLPLARRTLLFADLPSTDQDGRAEAFRLISDAARRADNLGIDEIPTFDYFDYISSFSDDVIAVYEDVVTGEAGNRDKMVGLIMIQGCRYVRSSHPSNFSLFIVTGETISSRLVWRDLTRLGFEMGITGPNGYTGCTIDVFMTCFERVAALRDEGFVITACVPDAGFVTGFPKRHIDSYVMYKELQITPKPRPLMAPNDESTDDDDEIPDDVNLLTIPYLPVRHVLADGTPIVIRGLRDHDEIRSFYAVVKAAIASGDGYGIDELPNISYFVRWYITDFYNIVYELAPPPSSPEGQGDTEHSGQVLCCASVIAYGNFGRSQFSRSADNPMLSDGNTIILPEFRGKRWASELNSIQFGLGYDVGYRGVFGETSTCNMSSLLSMKRAGVTLTGSIPRGIYFKDLGWTDSVLLHLSLSESFEKQSKSLRKRHLVMSKI